MSPNSPTPGSDLSAAEINEQIRALWARAGGTLSEVDRREYEQLVVAWASAVRAELVRAA
ncbi:hypothetical protein [Streptomyces sp. NPDC002692]